MPLKDLEARKEYKRKWYQKWKKKHPDAGKKNWEQIKNNPVLYNKNKKQHQKASKNPERQLYQKNAFLKTTYGITLEDYNKMLEEQHCCCQICGRHQSEFKKALHVEHRHSDGKIRGLVCSYCNHGLAFLENEFLLPRLIEYLEHYE